MEPTTTFKEDSGSGDELFSLTGNSQPGILKDLDSQTLEIFNDSQILKQEIDNVLNGKLWEACGSQSSDIATIPINIDGLSSGNASNVLVISSTSVPDHLRKHPVLDVFTMDDVRFEVSFPGKASERNGWMYSDKLSKLFLKLDSTCSFLLKYVPLATSMYVRAMLLYQHVDDQHDTVSRCDNHRCSDATNHPEDVKMHVVRCKNNPVEYVGLKDGLVFEERLAVKVPLESAGRTTLTLEFVCQSSCKTIKRRPMALVFTMEDAHGVIWGRQLYNVKICTNLKRDMQNEEATQLSQKMARKRKASNMVHGPNRCRMRLMKQRSAGKLRELRVQPTVIDPVTVTIRMPNLRMARRLLESAVGIISTPVVHATDDGERETLMTFIDDARQQKATLGLGNSQSSIDSEYF